MTRHKHIEYLESCLRSMRDNIATNDRLRAEAWDIIATQDLTIAELRAQVANFVTLTEQLRQAYGVRRQAG